MIISCKKFVLKSIIEAWLQFLERHFLSVAINNGRKKAKKENRILTPQKKQEKLKKKYK